MRLKHPELPLEPGTEKDFYCPVCGAENPEKIYEVPGQGAVGWLQYRHMPIILQQLIYIKYFFSYGKINNIF